MKKVKLITFKLTNLFGNLYYVVNSWVAIVNNNYDIYLIICMWHFLYINLQRKHEWKIHAWQSNNKEEFNDWLGIEPRSPAVKSEPIIIWLSQQRAFPLVFFLFLFIYKLWKTYLVISKTPVVPLKYKIQGIKCW